MSIGIIIFICILIILLIVLIRYYVVNNTVLTKLTNATILQTVPSTSLNTSTDSVGSSNYAYSIWFYISNWNYKYGNDKIIFARINTTPSDSSFNNIENSLSVLDPCPIVYLDKFANDIMIGVSSYGTNNKSQQTNLINVNNIPIQRWVNLILSVYNTTVDVYINGKLVKTEVMSNSAYVNSNDNIIITPAGGFEGSTTKLQYYQYSLNPEQAWNIYQQGYGNASLANLFGSYQLSMSISQNGVEEASFTI
jgi:hypothetical protein